MAETKLLNRRAFFGIGAGALGAAAVAVVDRSSSRFPHEQAYVSPSNRQHHKGNSACPCPICSGTADKGKTAYA